jgi:modulator of FtsH protease
MSDNMQVLGREASVSVQNKVLRNTYMLLGITMIPTLIGAVIGVNMQFTFAAEHPIMFALGTFAAMMGLLFGVQASRNSPMGIVLLLAFTGLAGLLLGPILQHALHLRNGAQLVGLAAAGTGLIFMTLATVATVTKKDFGFLGNFLFIGIIMLVIASIANLFLQIPAFSLALSGVAVLLFAGFMLYDVSRIVNGGETNYVMATLAIYLDIYNMFTNLLHLLMAFAGED